MKIVSYNINGIRASEKLGLLDWIENFDADIYCFQEVRASEDIVLKTIYNKNKQMSLFEQTITRLEKYTLTLNCGKKAGYAGTMILSKQKPDKVIYGMQEFWQDDEGRTTTIIIKDLAVVDTYIPNGNSRLDFKMQYISALEKYIQKLSEFYKVVCVGDYNIAHNEIDLTNPKECKTKSVFLPEERQAFQKLLDCGFVDSFRFLNPNKVCYSWRSYRSRMDLGYKSWQYRIDYALCSNNLRQNLVSCSILDLIYSDHLPVVLEMIMV